MHHCFLFYFQKCSIRRRSEIVRNDIQNTYTIFVRTVKFVKYHKINQDLYSQIGRINTSVNREISKHLMVGWNLKLLN